MFTYECIQYGCRYNTNNGDWVYRILLFYSYMAESSKRWSYIIQCKPQLIDFAKDRVTVRNFGLPPSKKKKKCVSSLSDPIMAWTCGWHKKENIEVCGRSKEFSEECFYQNDNW